MKDANFTEVRDMTIDAQGRIVVVGPTPGALGQSDFGVFRFNSNGTDDTGFAGDGSTQVAFDLDLAHNRTTDLPSSVTTSLDGSVYVAGLVLDITGGGAATGRVGVAKLMPDGTNTNTGYGTLPFGRQVFCSATCEDASGVAKIIYDATRNRIVIGGHHFLNSSNSNWFIITQNFGTSPSSTTSVYPIDFAGASSTQFAYMTSLAVQADGKVLALGAADDVDYNTLPLVLRRQADSTAEDLSFGNVSSRGIMLLGDSINLSYADLVVDSSGRIVLAGFYPNQPFGIATRLLPTTGAVDFSFAGQVWPKVYRAKTSNGSQIAHDTLFQRVFLDAGRLVLAGEATDSSTEETDYDLIITRLQSDSIFANGFQ